MDKVAVIDIGSNSSLLLLVQKLDKRYVILREEYAVTRISEGLFESGSLQDFAVNRTIRVVKSMVMKARQENAAIMIIGTEPFRIAVNLNEVQDRFRLETGYNVRVLKPEEEAMLAYYAVHDWNDPVLTADVGGASSEIVLGKSKQMERWISVPLGAVRVTKEFGLDQAVPPTKLAAVRKELSQKLLPDLHDFLKCPLETGIFSGGTITTLAAMLLGLDEYRSEKVEGKSFPVSEFGSLVEELAGLSQEKRRKMRGMEIGREDVIVGGGILIGTLANILGMKSIRISTGGIRMGLVKMFFDQKEIL